MSTNVNISDGMQPGQSYTFLFQPRGFNPFVTGIDIAQDLQAVDYLSNVHVNAGVGVGPVYVQFDYEGDGTDSVDYVASDIVNAVGANHTLFSLEFASGTVGVVNKPTVGDVVKNQTTGIPNLADALGLSTTNLVLIVGGLLLVVFLASGGAGAVRRGIE